MNEISIFVINTVFRSRSGLTDITEDEVTFDDIVSPKHEHFSISKATANYPEKVLFCYYSEIYNTKR